MNDRYVITGGAGLVGTAVARALLERNDDVVIYDSGEACGFDYVRGTGAHIVEGDIRDADQLNKAAAGARAVIHLAAQTGVPKSISDPVGDNEINVRGSLNVLEAARLNGVKRLVFASSNSVVAGNPSPMREDLLPRPVAPYGAAKAAVEAYLAAYHRAYGLSTVALRFSNVYGPYSAHKSSVIGAFVKAYRAGGPLLVNGNGRQTRDFVYVGDLANAIVKVLDADDALVSGETFQLGSGHETSLLELAELLFAAGGRRVPIEHRAASAGDVPRNYSDISKARAVLGFSTDVELSDGLRQTLDWFAARFD